MQHSADYSCNIRCERTIGTNLSYLPICIHTYEAMINSYPSASLAHLSPELFSLPISRPARKDTLSVYGVGLAARGMEKRVGEGRGGGGKAGRGRIGEVPGEQGSFGGRRANDE